MEIFISNLHILKVKRQKNTKKTQNLRGNLSIERKSRFLLFFDNNKSTRGKYL